MAAVGARDYGAAVWDLASAYQPLTGRQLYHRAVVAGMADKDEGRS